MPILIGAESMFAKERSTDSVLIFLILLFAGCGERPEAPSWNQEKGYRWAELPEPVGENDGFRTVSRSESGIAFANTLSEEAMVDNRLIINGSGVAVGDVDGDEWPDVYFASLEGSNALYRNKGGWKFEDITASAGVAVAGRASTGAALEDLDGDGDLDLLVTTLIGPNAVFFNDGKGVFTEVTDSVGLASSAASTTMGLADADGDGDLDLYVTNYKDRSVRDIYPPDERSFEKVVREDDEGFTILPPFENDFSMLTSPGMPPRRIELAQQDAYYENDGTGRFTEVPFTSGRFLNEDGTPLKENYRDWGLTVRFQDFNGDGAPDLYVCNDFEGPDHFWINDGKGVFKPAPPLALRKTSNSTMSVALADVDLDGDLDFFAADMLSRDPRRRLQQLSSLPPTLSNPGDIEDRPQVVRNTFFINRGDGTYAEQAWLADVAATEWTWSALFVDVDLDGYEDLLVSNGHVHDNMNADTQMRLMQQPPGEDWQRMILQFPDLKLNNLAFRNRGDGSFEAYSKNWQFGSEADVSNGMASADFDRDGDLDIVANRMNQEPLLMENRSVKPRVSVLLKGLPPNTQGIGARIVLVESDRKQTRVSYAAGEYLSDGEAIQSFGMKGEEATLEVYWQNGKRSVVAGVQAGRVYQIEEPEGLPALEQPVDTGSPPLFVETDLEHVHSETAFNDRARQPLLPRRLTELGPGLVWADLDLDGDEDLLVGSGAGGAMARFENRGGILMRVNDAVLGQRVEGDIAGVVALPVDNGVQVLAGVSNYEFTGIDSSYIQMYTIENGRTRDTGRLSFDYASIGALALGDVDQDGDLDLFAAGRVIAGAYPVPIYSRLYEQTTPGTWQMRVDWNDALRETGMITGAAFGDIDDDGRQDLVLATEWGSIQVLRNQGNGFFSHIADPVLERHKGWWQSVELGDFNADGRLDILAGNWGWNSRYGRLDESGGAVRIYFGDYDNNRSLDLIQSAYDAQRDGFFPTVNFNQLLENLPPLRTRVNSYQQYANMKIEDLLGPQIQAGDVVEANTLAHYVFLNTTTGFEERILPIEAQSFPAFGLALSDVDFDGHEDIYLGGNFQGFPVGEGRIDAGRGLWLKGDGAGNFRTLDAGIVVYGEQRGVAIADFNEDGSPDMAISQNANETKLYQGVGETGVRIVLEGPSENPWAVGAQLARVDEAGNRGHVRLIKAGSGYWSQHGRVQLLPAGQGSIWVRWPNGREDTYSTEEDQNTYVFSFNSN